MKQRYFCLVLFLLCVSPAWAAEWVGNRFGVDVNVSARAEDDRDLGTRKGGDIHGLSLDLRPWVYFGSGAWSGFVMAQAVSATDGALPSVDFQDETRRSDSRTAKRNYLALRELWVGYSGLSAYPGEALRLGRQRLRDDGSGLWRDTSIEALAWNFDTTLLRAHLGVAERFSEYRSDIHDLAAEDKDRLHVFGDISRQWRPGHWLGFNFHHRRDHDKLKRPGETVDTLDKTRVGKLFWFGVHASSEAFTPRNDAALNYWTSAFWSGGERDRLTTATVGDHRIATGKRDDDVDAGWGVDLGLRWRFNAAGQVGIAYAHGNNDFQQTGLESNRSAFTGTRARPHRLGEAFRGELANLRVVSAFASWQVRDEYDINAIWHRFQRADGDQVIGGSAISAAMTNNDKDVGQEFDFVLSRYFRNGLLPAAISQAFDEPSAVVRLRGGVFWPGHAYGREVDSTMYRTTVDVMWRF
ncbi:alginate production protein AlgE [Betaproteobacteria bacterium]|nr:alginate production protein AlgE [Betaproteobacteria bacterium]GHU03271.1 alginate production protein AlgE [Betaproteobacteria bacterium]GHU21779.1 alginate production protein AlgE [Betaproteobacteria bacterium]